jgi:NADH dehydrogenase
VDLTEKVIAACRANGVRRLLHMSALNADATEGTSHYLRTKGQAEEKVRAAEEICSTIFRPSVIFGPEDSFFNRFAWLLRTFPLAFPLACPKARFAPVYVDDVAEVFIRSLKRPDTCGKRFNLCGPHSYTLEQLVTYTAHCIGARRWIIPLPDMLSRLQASVFDFVPGKPFSTDNYLSAQVDSVCAGNDFEFFGIMPASLESRVPAYLSGKVQQTRYQEFRSHSHRDAGT